MMSDDPKESDMIFASGFHSRDDESCLHKTKPKGWHYGPFAPRERASPLETGRGAKWR